jgi:protein-tyrosine phosphatase
VVQQENDSLRQSIEELESASVWAPGSHTFTPASPSVSVLAPGSPPSTPVSPANTPLNQPAEYLVSHLIDSVISLTQLGDFTTDHHEVEGVAVLHLEISRMSLTI